MSHLCISKDMNVRTRVHAHTYCNRQDLGSCFVVACCYGYCTSQRSDLAQLAPTSKGAGHAADEVQRPKHAQGWQCDPMEDAILSNTHTRIHTFFHSFTYHMINLSSVCMCFSFSYHQSCSGLLWFLQFCKFQCSLMFSVCGNDQCSPKLRGHRHGKYSRHVH